MATFSQLFIIALIGYTNCSNTTGWILNQSTAESELAARLLAIDPTVRRARPRPRTNHSGPTFVDVRAHLVRVINVDSRRQSFSISAFFEVGWRNANFTWNPDDFEGIRKIVTSADKFWMPDIGLLNSLEGDFDFSQKKEDMNVMVFNDGWIKWYPGGIYNVGCHLDLTYFPFDTQECSFYFISWMYTYHELQLHTRKPTMDYVTFMAKAQWEVHDVSVTNRSVYFKPGNEGSKWSLLEVKITCSREPGYYITNVIVPAIIISLLVLTVFILPCDSGEKVSLGITVLVAFTVFQLVIADTLPKNAKSTPYIVIYLTTLMGTTAITTLMSVVVLNIHHTGSERKLSPMLRFVIFNILGCLTRYCRHTYKVDRLRYKKGKSYSATDDENNLTGLPKAATENNPGEVVKLLQEILKETRIMNARKIERQSESEIAEEWKDAAKIVDRFLMMLYILAVAIITVTFLGILPSHQRR